MERLNRTFKSSYRVTCGYGNDEGAIYWVAYYNYPYSHLKRLDGIDNMPC